jgi:hypothetical protein
MKPRLLLALALVGLLCACSGDDSDRKDRTATPAEGTSAPGSAATPGSSITAQALGLQTRAVKWVDADVFDPKTITESLDPFNHYERLKQPAGTPQAWSLFASKDGALPAPLYETTNRFLRNVTWTRDGVAVQFSTRRVVTITASGDKATLNWQGTLTVDPSTGRVREEFEALPSTGGNDSPGSQLDDKTRTVTVQRDQGDTQAVLSVGTGNGPFRRIEAVYLIDKQGKARRLEGLNDLRQVNWLPSGGALQAFAAPPANTPFRPTNETYIIPTSDGQAIYIGEAPARAEGFNATGASKGSRMLILVPDRNSTTPGASLMLLYDTRKFDLRVLGPGPAVLLPNPAGFPTQVPITWPDASDEIAIGTGGGPDGVIVNVKTGASRPGSSQELLQLLGPAENLSPNKRLVATTDPPATALAGSVDCRGKPSRLKVTDKQTGTPKTLLECPSGLPGQVKWIDDSHLLVTIYNCYACEPGSAAVTLVNVDSGRAVQLTNGLEPNTDAMPSPDGRRVVVTGERLRVYDADGALVSDLGPLSIELRPTSLAWSSDNKSLAYILGPQ